MNIQHEKLGDCKVLLEVNLNNGKCFKMVEAYKVKKSKTYWDRRRWGRTEDIWLDTRLDGRSKRPHFYALWGNTQDPSKMGVTKLTTKGGNNPSINKSSKYFFELVKASEYIQFSK
jgi:hypothetical protein